MQQMVLYSSIWPATGEACKRENIKCGREIGTTIRQIWLTVVETGSWTTRRPSTMPSSLLETALWYCAGKDDKTFLLKN